MRRAVRGITLALLLAMGATELVADTPVGGTINVNTTWTLANSPYLVTSGVTVNAGVTLTVEPGVVVKFNSDRWLNVNGTLLAVGTTVSPISFVSAQATPLPGSWAYLRLGSGASASRLEHVTVSDGGLGANWAGRGALQIDNSSPFLDQVEITRSGARGLKVTGAGAQPRIEDSSITDGVTVGAGVESGARLEIARTTIAGNLDYAIQVGPNSQLLDGSDLTLSGNGAGAKDAAQYLTGTISTQVYWISGLEWHLLGAVTVAQSGSLELEKGVTVRLLGSSTILTIQGTMIADGTAEFPIELTSLATSPMPGDWASLRFTSTASSTSLLRWVNISYGGRNQLWSGQAAIEVDRSSPTLEHITIRHSGSRGLKVQRPSAIVTSNCVFTDFVNSTFRALEVGGTGEPVVARLCYWNSPTGPGAPGGAGQGQPISSGVEYEPWLLSEPTSDEGLTWALPENRTFNPDLQIFTRISFKTFKEASWEVRYLDPSQVLVRTISGYGDQAVVEWDATTDIGFPVPDGTYNYEIETPVGAGTAPIARGVVVVDRTRQLTITNVTVSEPFFSPNGDGIQDTTTFSGDFNFEGVDWTVDVINPGGTVIRSATGQGSSFSFTWNGSALGQPLPDGTYQLKVTASAGTATTTASSQTVLDVTFPTTAFHQPADLSLLSNVHQSGLDDVEIWGTASDTNILNWSLAYRVSPNGGWSNLATGTASVVNAMMKLWSTLERMNGAYDLRILSADRAGNVSSTLRGVKIGNFQVSHAPPWEFDGGAGQTANYTSTVPFKLVERLTIRDLSGAIVRTLYDGYRDEGTHVDTWSGTGDLGNLLPDGGYLYIAEVWDDPHYMSWDLTNEYRGTWWQHNNNLNIQPFDPFNNQPMTFSYNFTQPGRVSIGFGPGTPVQAHCNPPNFCLLYNQYQDSRPRTIQWAGVDETGALRPDLRGVGVMTMHHEFSKNAIVLYGSAPTVMSVESHPPVIGPATGSAEITFDLTTYDDEPVDVTIQFRNQESLSDLRTITAPATLPGPVSIEWDGRADNGMLVAPGRYTITVTATDPRGNVARGQILARVQY